MLREELIQYSNEVISGKLIACQKHKWACARFIRDLNREGTEEFPYLFDEELAERFLDWMRLFKHRKGVLKGQYLEPHIIQKFVFGNIYGWIHKDTGYRRFNKAYWQVARKNAKSQSLACVGSYELMALGEGTSEVYCAATKTEQAKIVWEETEAMLNACQELKGRFRVAYGKIIHIKTASIMKALSKEDRKSGDGLNPQCGIIDEYHAHDTSEIYDIIDSGMIARPQPLLMIITTAGFELSNPCYSVEYKLVSKVLDPNNPYENENYFVMINELDKGDDIKDERNWPKANPIVCSYSEGVESIRKRLNLALEAPEKMRDFLTKTVNIWVQMRENGYMDMEKWAACGATKENPFPDVTRLPVTVGIDLSAVLDLTSVGFEIPLPDGTIAVLSHSFIPEETLEKKRRMDKVPYDLWVRQEWITATPGAEVDYHFVLEYILKTYEKYNWYRGEACFDRYLATWLMHELSDMGFTPVEIPQGIPTLSEPTKDFRAKAYNKKVIHDNNPVLSWAMSNAVTRMNAQESIMLDKSKSTERIDPVASLINAHVRVMVNEDNVSVYEERGVRAL
jgi:phage terminase large subunit-like protein